MAITSKTGGGVGTNQYQTRGSAKAPVVPVPAVNLLDQSMGLTAQVERPVEVRSGGQRLLYAPALRGDAPPTGSSATNDGDRQYVSPRTGLKVPSVTTVIGVVRHIGLEKWRDNQLLDAMDEMQQSGELDKLRADGLSWQKIRIQVKEHASANMSVGADRGSSVHTWIENTVANECGYKVPVPELTGAAAAAAESWKAWRSKHDIKWMGIECTMFNDTQGYAGTGDFIAQIDGETVIGDYKTGATLRPSVWPQLAALSHAEYLVDRDGVQHELPPITGGVGVLLDANGYQPRYMDAPGLEDAWQHFRALHRVRETEYTPPKPPIMFPKAR